MAPGGLVYHVLNRAVARLALFEKDSDYEAFERVLAEAMEKHPTRLLGYCVMPNHWHLVIWPREEGELTEFVRWLTHTHVMRWHQFGDAIEERNGCPGVLGDPLAEWLLAAGGTGKYAVTQIGMRKRGFNKSQRAPRIGADSPDI
jgi:REP element-mobilizing transposase RayT